MKELFGPGTEGEESGNQDDNDGNWRSNDPKRSLGPIGNSDVFGVHPYVAWVSPYLRRREC